MPDESCRKCGTELQIRKNCDNCSSPVLFFCPKCMYVPDKQIHVDCMLAKNQIVIIGS